MASKQTLSVAIIGATGNIGTNVTKAFLNDHPKTFSRVVVLTRNANSEKAKALEKLGAELIQYDGVLKAENLRNIDILVSCTNTRDASAEEKESVYKAAIAAGVKVYLPSEYGNDPRASTINHLWARLKKEHSAAARAASAEAGGRLKIIEVYTGPFLDLIYLPFGGWDAANLQYTSVGNSTAKWTLTAREDIAKSVAKFSELAAKDPASVPDRVRVAGVVVSYDSLAETVGKARGEKIKVVVRPAPEEGQEEGKDPQDFIVRLQLNIARGDADYSKVNDNELVNPGQTLWKWKTAEEYITEADKKA